MMALIMWRSARILMLLSMMFTHNNDKALGDM